MLISTLNVFPLSPKPIRPSRLNLEGIPALNHILPLHPTACTRLLHLAISLKERDETGMAAFLAAVNNPNSPDYHHFLTPTELAARFGPTPTAVAAIVAYLHAHGFTNVVVAPNHLMIDATAPVGTVEQAFAVTIDDFPFAGHTVFAPINEPSAPRNIASTLLQVGGLDDLAPGMPVR